jgi:CRAL/TRIO domain
MIMDILLSEDDVSIIAGITILADFKDGTMGHVMQMTPILAKKITTVIQEGLPLRIKSMNFIYMPSFFETVFKLVTSFLNEKMRSRVK